MTKGVSLLIIQIILSILLGNSKNNNYNSFHVFAVISIIKNVLAKKSPEINFDGRIILYKLIVCQVKNYVLHLKCFELWLNK